MKRQKPPSSTSKILQAVSEMAMDLHRQGAIDQTVWQQYQDLCLKPTYASEELRTLRQRYSNSHLINYQLLR